MNVKVDLETHGRIICRCDLLVPPEIGDLVVIVKNIVEKIGRIVDIGAHLSKLKVNGKIVRYATINDKISWQEIREREIASIQIAKNRIEHFNLPMKIVNVEIDNDEGKIRFFFVAEERVDFRELVRDLAKHLRSRVDLRQIGVRDYATRLGGIGPCGRETCCSLFLKDFKPITLQIVKDQNLNLNIQKISGVCGRLMCCMMYEWENYKKVAHLYPEVGSIVKTKEDEEVEIVSTHIYNRKVTVKKETGVIKTIPLSDLKNRK